MNYFLVLFFVAFAFAQEESEAMRAMKTGCHKRHSGLACYNYANMLLRKDRTSEAEEYFKKGCELGHEGACQQERWDIPLPESSEEEGLETETTHE